MSGIIKIFPSDDTNHRDNNANVLMSQVSWFKDTWYGLGGRYLSQNPNPTTEKQGVLTLYNVWISRSEIWSA